MTVPGSGKPTEPVLLNVKLFSVSGSNMFGMLTQATGAVSVAPYPS